MPKEDTKNHFMEAYNQYSDAIFRYCFYKTSNREKALDLVQDTFVKTWEYLSKGKKIDNLKAFLYKTANNLIIDWFRKKKMSSLDELREAGFDPIFDQGDNTINRLDGEIALEAVQSISPIYREVIMMHYVEELSISEIAQVLEEKENNISVRLYRAMEKLRQVLEEREEKTSSRYQRKK